MKINKKNNNKNFRITTAFVNFVNKIDTIISPKPEIEKLTADNLNELKNAININSQILNDLANLPAPSAFGIYAGEIKIFLSRELADIFIQKTKIILNLDFRFSNQKGFLNHNPQSQGNQFSGGNSCITSNHIPRFSRVHSHTLTSRVFTSSGGSSSGLLERSDLRNAKSTSMNNYQWDIGSPSPQTIYNLLYYQDVFVIEFLRDI